MGELHFGLLSIGVLVILGVFFYNKWQERRYQRQAEAAFGARHEDVLMRAGGEADWRAPERVEPSLERADTSQAPAEASVEGLSESLDYIVPLETPDEVPGAEVLDASVLALEGCTRSVQWEGFDGASASWGPLDAGGSYSKMRVGLQLVDRRGAATPEELAAFGGAIEEAMAPFGLLATPPDASQALARAQELDRFCGEVDIRIAVHLVNERSPFPGARLDAAAKGAGFELDEPDGKFRYRDDAGRIVFALANFEPIPFKVDSLETLSTQAVTLELDVPRSPHGSFARFRETAERFAKELNARIVDDNRQPVGASAFDAISAQVLAVHRSMAARGITPGGALALRLFS